MNGLPSDCTRPMLVSVFDTTITDNNLGNEIIMEAVYNVLRSVFPWAFFIKLPYLEAVGPESLRYLQRSDYVFFGGTNSLTSDMRKYKQWGIDEQNAEVISNVVLMGMGWWQYQGPPTPYTRRLLGKVLDHSLLHAVRDTYTAEKLREAGFGNVIVTGCPSMWSLTPEHCQSVPTHKSDDVLLTVTNYNQDPQNDLNFVRLLSRKYRKLYCWIQGPEDYDYAKHLSPDIYFIPPNLKALDEFLATNSHVDYVGTRLHAGIRALQFKKRTIILGIDNRAIEKGKDFSLPVIPRGDLDALEKKIDESFETRLKLPLSDIQRWLGQFADASDRVGVQPDATESGGSPKYSWRRGLRYLIQSLRDGNNNRMQELLDIVRRYL